MTILENVSESLKEWLTSPEVLRTVAMGLRHTPIWVVAGTAVVSRYEDVREVLENDEDFGVTEIYDEKMRETTGAFFLGMENTEQYRREATFTRAAVHDGDFARIARLTETCARELVDRARETGRIDAAADYSRRIPLRLLAEYFGTPGPNEATLARWMRTIFWHIFLNFSDDEAVSERAVQSGRELDVYLSELIQARKRELSAGRASADDFVSRLVKQQAAAQRELDDDALRRSIGGVIVGAVDTQSKAICHALQQLFAHPDAFRSAQRAAREGDDELVAAYVWEALRFNPHNPLLTRHCRHGTKIAAGTDREAEIPRDTKIYALTLSAMFDDKVLEQPEEFRPGRPRQHYLHFGHGQHRCFGERINLVVVPRAIKELLLLEDLRPAEDGPGRIDYEGPFPDHYPLEFRR